MTHNAVTITKRPSDQRGTTEIGWLYSRHTFSFGQYHDPKHRGYRSLRVINDDIIEPGQGFGMHGHRDMEILTYIVAGELEHKDSMGNGRIICAGELQYMSAGDGVRHSEFNPSATDSVHLLQIWIEPRHPGGEPRYADMDTTALPASHGLVLLASPDGRDGSMAIRQGAELCFGALQPDTALTISAEARLEHHWLHVIAGDVHIDAHEFATGDSGAIEGGDFVIHSGHTATFLLFRLA